MMVPAASYEELRASYGKLPSTALAFAPIVVPILAMALGSIAAMAKWTGLGADLARFVGTPIIALGIGTLIAIALLATTDRMKEFYDVTEQTLKVVGPILFITAAGGVLGRVIANTDIVNFITENAAVMASIGMFFPFLLSAILKTAQGSSPWPSSPRPASSPRCCPRWASRPRFKSHWPSWPLRPVP